MHFYTNVYISAEDIATALKENFAKAMALDPGAAADIARAMAVALASAGASADSPDCGACNGRSRGIS